MACRDSRRPSRWWWWSPTFMKNCWRWRRGEVSSAVVGALDRLGLFHTWRQINSSIHSIALPTSCSCYKSWVKTDLRTSSNLEHTSVYSSRRRRRWIFNCSVLSFKLSRGLYRTGLFQFRMCISKWTRLFGLKKLSSTLSIIHGNIFWKKLGASDFTLGNPLVQPWKRWTWIEQRAWIMA